jgi:ribulose-5-phosphate 4-epimerase/fuculose-1-phosphate aldolase
MNGSDSIRGLLQLCLRIYDKDFVSGSGGNVSVRDGDTIVITPTGRNLGLLEERDIVRLRLSGEVIGPGKPSQEWRMHVLCYARDDVACVVHAHSSYATALSCLATDPACAMPTYTPGYAVRVGKLPVLPYLRPGSEALAGSVGGVIAGNGSGPGRNSVLLANHGLLAVGANLEQAMNIAEEIEENARLFFILNGKGRALGDEQQADLAGKY